MGAAIRSTPDDGGTRIECNRATREAKNRCDVEKGMQQWITAARIAMLAGQNNLP
jgi:hypothetical protein